MCSFQTVAAVFKALRISYDIPLTRLPRDAVDQLGGDSPIIFTPFPSLRLVVSVCGSVTKPHCHITPRRHRTLPALAVFFGPFDTCVQLVISH